MLIGVVENHACSQGNFVMDEIHLTFPGKVEHLHLATMLAREVCADLKHYGVAEGFIFSVEIAVSEACTNAVKHGISEDGTNPVTISFKTFAKKLTIEVRDKGKGFDPTQIATPDFEKHPESGYGLYIIKQKMDDVQYKSDATGNVLVMTKNYQEFADD